MLSLPMTSLRAKLPWAATICMELPEITTPPVLLAKFCCAVLELPKTTLLTVLLLMDAICVDEPEIKTGSYPVALAFAINKLTSSDKMVFIAVSLCARNLNTQQMLKNTLKLSKTWLAFSSAATCS